MPTAQYSTIEEAEKEAKGIRRGTPSSNNTSPSLSNDNNITAVNNSSCPMNKRRRTSSSTSPPENIRDLAVEPLTHVASFLAAPSRAMFGIALSSKLSHLDGAEVGPPQTIWWINPHALTEEDESSASVKKIAGKYENLDFGEIEKSLAAKLTDDDMYNIILCLDRPDNRIKKFRLTNCINITGTGIERFYGSDTIEMIDLSILPDHINLRKPKFTWSYNIRLSFPNVETILDSVIDNFFSNCSLQYLHLPWYWRYHPKPEVNGFIARYKRMWKDRHTVCAKCTCRFEPQVHHGGILQMNTCSICTKHYCFDCEDENGQQFISTCNRCDRVHCQACVSMENCACCRESFCKHHCGGSEVWKKDWGRDFEECSGCDEKICGACAFERTCKQCRQTDCGWCRHQNGDWRNGDYSRHVEECTICNITWCRSCKSWKECDHCDEPIICEECISERTCNHCHESFCTACRSISECKVCNQNWCSDCDPSRAWGRDSRDGYCVDCAKKEGNNTHHFVESEQSWLVVHSAAIVSSSVYKQ